MEKLGMRIQAQIKRIYQINEQSYNKIAKLEEKKAKIDAELTALQDSVSTLEKTVQDVTGGYTSKDLIKVSITPVFNADGTPKLDKTGRQVKYKKYSFEYPTESVSTDDSGVEDTNSEAIPNAPEEPVTPPTL